MLPEVSTQLTPISNHYIIPVGREYRACCFNSDQATQHPNYLLKEFETGLLELALILLLLLLVS